MERRNFFRLFLGGAALSTAAINSLNSAVYQSIKNLNEKYIKDNSPDGVYWDSIAKHFLFENNLIMMNNGTVGPMPKPVFNTLMHEFKVQCTNPFECYDYLPSKKDAVRNKIAKFINASPDEVAITRNTTEGLNVIASGLKLEKGDEIILSSQEHPAGLQPWLMRSQRHGIKIVEARLGAPPKSIDEILQSFENAITPRTKVISVSHTVYLTGLIFPLKELCQMAKKHNIFVLADSAHGIGMLDLNMKELGVDAFTSSPYKWCGAPTGCGILYVKKESQDRIWPLIASSGWDTHKSAKRFETLGQRADPLIFALGEAIEFQKRIGKRRIERRIKTLAGYLKKELKSIPHVRLHTPTDPYLSGGLTAFSIEGVKPEQIVYYLKEKYNLVIRTIGREKDNTRGVRVSTNIFISMKHIDMLLEGVQHLVKHRA